MTIDNEDKSLTDHKLEIELMKLKLFQMTEEDINNIFYCAFKESQKIEFNPYYQNDKWCS